MAQRSDTKAKKNLQTTKNPIQHAREELGLTQLDLCAVADVSKPLVVHVEQGMLANVPESILETLDDYDSSSLRMEYKNWVFDTRTKNAVYLEAAIPNFLMASCDGYGDWLYLRNTISSSKAGFAKLFCLHLQILDTFEKKIESRNNFTKGMRDCLKDCITMDMILDMELAMSRFHRYRSGS